MKLPLEFQCETCFLLRCNRKVRILFHPKKGNRPSCIDQEGRRGSDLVVPGNSIFLSSETGMLENFLSCIKVSSTISNFKRERGILLKRCSDNGPHFVMTLAPRGFSRVMAGFWSTTGNSGSLSCCQGKSILQSSCKGELGIALESLQGT